jgi:hypothetical protein
MITEISREELIAIGRPQRADYLCEQAGYTLGLAALDGKAIEEILPDGFIAEVGAALSKVNAARQDKALMVSESSEAGKGAAKAVRAAKVWRRKVAQRALAASRIGKAIPDGLTRISQARTQPEIASQLVEMTKLFEASLPLLHGKGLDALLQQGKDLAQALQASDATQEVKRLKELPDSVKEFWAQKGTLYIGLKVINDAGHELWADSPGASSKYNLSILHRHGNHGGGADGDIGTPKPPETKA